MRHQLRFMHVATVASPQPYCYCLLSRSYVLPMGGRGGGPEAGRKGRKDARQPWVPEKKAEKSSHNFRSSQACDSQKGLLHSRSQCKMHPGVYLLMRVELSGSGFCATNTPQIISTLGETCCLPGTHAFFQL